MERCLQRVYSSRKISLALRIISCAAVFIYVGAFAAILIFTAIESIPEALKLGAAAALPFVLVTLIRKLINAPRPYELYPFYKEKPKKKCGQSFPSRHTFSAFVIGTLAFGESAWLGAALLVIGASMAVARVLLGLHFIRDVIAGALIGAVCGIIGIIILI